MAAPDGILVVDKPADWTSHDVVARCRRIAATRRIGHAGTLDPMATGVLVLGVGRATRMLGHLALTTKGYDATIRLGESTVTDDAQGDVVAAADAGGLDDERIRAEVARLTGDLMQVPSAVSAIKIKGERAYKRVRDGEVVELPPRPVQITEFSVGGIRRSGAVIDVDAHVECSSGTYIRALARDLGAELGVGGHLTALRRTRVGEYGLDQARTIDDLTMLQPDDLPVERLDVVARRSFAWCVVAGDLVAGVRNGRAVHVRLRSPDAESRPAGEPDLTLGPVDGGAADLIVPGSTPTPVAEGSFEPGERGDGPPGPVAVLAPGGAFLALYEQHGPVAQAVAVFDPA